MTTTPLFESASEILNQRTAWEAKYRKAYKMRHDGLERQKTADWQADGHSKTIDRAVRKGKPYDIGQVTAGDRIWNFTSLQDQLEDMTESAANYQDFKIRNQTDFFRKYRVMVDYRRLHGFGLLKCFIDPLQGFKIIFEAIDPMFLLMAESAKGFEDADEWVHVRTMSVAAYKRLDKRWTTDADTIQKIKGNSDYLSLGIAEQQKRQREGITWIRNDKNILIWEHWVRTGSGHSISYYSPMAPDIALRRTHGNPYKFNGNPSIPFFYFPFEVKDEGWYSSRGLGELLDVQEQHETMLLNLQADNMILRNRILFTSKQQIQNTANIRFEDGSFVGGGIEAVQLGGTPVGHEEALMQSRQTSEEISQAPDTGITSKEGRPGKPETAAFQNRVASIQNVSTDDNGWLLREDLLKLGQHIWGMICQFPADKKDVDFTYITAKKIKKLPQEVLHEKYLISIDGSPDGWNKGARIQKAVAKEQTFRGNPNVNQERLTKDTLAAFDGADVINLFVPTNERTASEAQDEFETINSIVCPAGNLPTMLPTVKPNQDQAARLQGAHTWLQEAFQMKTPVSPIAQKMLMQLIGERLELLKKTNPPQAAQIAKAFMELEQQHAQQLTGGQPPGGTPPSPGAGPSAPPQSDPNAIKPSMNYKDTPEDVKRQIESKAGFTPSTLPPKPEPEPTKINS